MPLVLMAAFAGLAMMGDAADWTVGIRAAIDSAFLMAAAVLAALLWRELAPRGESAGDGP